MADEKKERDPNKIERFGAPLPPEYGGRHLGIPRPPVPTSTPPARPEKEKLNMADEKKERDPSKIERFGAPLPPEYGGPHLGIPRPPVPTGDPARPQKDKP